MIWCEIMRSGQVYVILIKQDAHRFALHQDNQLLSVCHAVFHKASEVCRVHGEYRRNNSCFLAKPPSLRLPHAAPKEHAYCGHKLYPCESAVMCCNNQDWCSSKRLQLNDDKTEIIWIGSRSSLKKRTLAETSLQLGSTTIEPAAICLLRIINST